MDSYQPIYDAVRSKISCGNVGDAVQQAARESLDISFQMSAIQQEFVCAAQEMQRPSVLFKPMLSADGSMWCALLGDNLQEGVAGFGETPAKAMYAFDEAFWKEPTPTAVRLGRETV
jgi:hypothetical protein